MIDGSHEAVGLSGVRAKLQRLDEHLVQLTEEIAAYIRSDPITVRGSFQGARWSARVLIERPPPLRASAIVGDIVHNARSALDHLLWQLVLSNGETPSRATQWPILDQEPTTGAQRKNFERMTAGISTDALVRVEWSQPYKRPDSPDQHVMYALRELSNTDKHRLPLTMVVAVEEHDESRLDLEFDDVEFDEPPRYGLVVSTALESGDELMFIDGVRAAGPRPQIKPSGTLPIQVAFGEVMTTAPGLVQIRDYVHMVVEDCAPSLDQAQ